MKILMSAAGSAAATTIVKHLRLLGHEVTGIDADTCSAPLAESVCDRFFLCPLAKDPDYVPFIDGLIESVDAFLPFLDEELALFADAILPESVVRKSLLSPAPTLLDCLSKQRFQSRCEALGLPIAARAEHPPAIFKPDHGRGSKGIVAIDDEEMLNCYRRYDGIIQERLSGCEYTVDVLVGTGGEWLFGLPRKRLQTAGVSRVGETANDEDILELARKCVEKMSFRYAINIQMIKPAGQPPKLIEINPRPAGSLMFSVHAGFDILDLAMKLFAGTPISLPKRIRNQRTIRYWQEVIFELG